MKKKNLLYILYTICFISICAVPAVFMPFKKSDTSAENRELSKMPSVMTDDKKLNLDYFDQFDTYFSEHFAFREDFVTLNSKLMADVFSTSTEDDVIIGKNDWLFYSYTANDYTGVNLLSQRGVNNISHNLKLFQEYCNENGALFVFTSAPNKNSIYPQLMPDRYYVTGETKNLHRISQRLSKLGVNYCDLEGVLSNYGINSADDVNSDDFVPIYHRTDTHWNNFGSYIARNALLDFIGKDYKNMTLGSTSDSWSGDLYKMLYPSGKEMDSQINFDYNFTYGYVGRFRGLDDLIINTSCETADGSLLMYRDSFGEAILPFMAEEYSTAEFSRVVPYRTSSISNGGVDTVILEIVERNLGNLQKSAPIMPAPVRDISFENALSGDAANILYAQRSNEYTHIYGELPNSYFKSDNTTIYVEADGIIYEAFNSYEDELLAQITGKSESDNGFSLYIPYTTDSINVKIIAADDSNAIQSPVTSLAISSDTIQ